MRFLATALAAATVHLFAQGTAAWPAAPTPAPGENAVDRSQPVCYVAHFTRYCKYNDYETPGRRKKRLEQAMLDARGSAAGGYIGGGRYQNSPLPPPILSDDGTDEDAASSETDRTDTDSNAGASHGSNNDNNGN